MVGATLRVDVLEEAREIGANAILGMRFTTTMTMPGAAEFLAYGTAVVLEDEVLEERLFDKTALDSDVVMVQSPRPS